MPKQTYEQKLLDMLNGLPGNQFFRIDNRPDFEKITETVKGFISIGEPFEFSSDYTKIKRVTNETLPPLYNLMKVLPVGVTLVKGVNSCEVLFNGKFIAIESLK